jgi:Diacylglycerol kinase
MKVRKLIDSFNYAIEGIIHTIQTQRNMRIHLIIAICILIFSLFFDLSRPELLILSISITLVLIMELVNTAIETTIDLFANYYHPLARIAKNAAAGAVLISAINALLVGYIIFFDRLWPMTSIVISKVKHSPPHITVICLSVVMLIVIGVKAYFGKGTPLKGGMPSGHSAIAFSVATILTLVTENVLVMVLSILLALLVVQSRIESKIHTFIETLIGGAFGVIITVLIFQIFSA